MMIGRFSADVPASFVENGARQSAARAVKWKTVAPTERLTRQARLTKRGGLNEQ